MSVGGGYYHAVRTATDHAQQRVPIVYGKSVRTGFERMCEIRRLVVVVVIVIGDDIVVR